MSLRARPTRRALAIALHCSGAGAGQWRQLGEMLRAGYELVAPEHYGTDSAGPWTGQHAFTLADEAARTLAIIDVADRDVHLIGHSYGGGLALHVALMRPDRIASLVLYEPSAFHLLRQFGQSGADGLAEIIVIARETGRGVITGDYRAAATSFVEYWSEQGAWSALRPELQAALIRWLPKAPLDFAALIEEQAEASAYARLRFPILIIRGEHAPAPTRLIAETLPTLLPETRLAVIAGAGHMGPLTHMSEVNALIAQHLAGAEARDRHKKIDATPRADRHHQFLASGATP